MSLATPEKIRTLQRKLYFKAKAAPDFRFYQRLTTRFGVPTFSPMPTAKPAPMRVQPVWMG